jgi:hypothetical protein
MPEVKQNIMYINPNVQQLQYWNLFPSHTVLELWVKHLFFWTVNAKAQVYTWPDSALCALKFGGCLFLLGYGKRNPAAGALTSAVTWLTYEFCNPPEWDTLTLISKKFWTKVWSNFSLSCLLLQDARMV